MLKSDGIRLARPTSLNGAIRNSRSIYTESSILTGLLGVRHDFRKLTHDVEGIAALLPYQLPNSSLLESEEEFLFPHAKAWGFQRGAR
jgi:hypothetical protein